MKKFCNPESLQLRVFEIPFSVNKWFMVSMHRLSYGCTWAVAKHESSIRVMQGNSQVQL